MKYNWLKWIFNVKGIMADRKLNQNPHKTGQTVHYLYTIYIQISLRAECNCGETRRWIRTTEFRSLVGVFPAYIYTHTHTHIYIYAHVAYTTFIDSLPTDARCKLQRRQSTSQNADRMHRSVCLLSALPLPFRLLLFLFLLPFLQCAACDKAAAVRLLAG